LFNLSDQPKSLSLSRQTRVAPGRQSGMTRRGLMVPPFYFGVRANGRFRRAPGRKSETSRRSYALSAAARAHGAQARLLGRLRDASHRLEDAWGTPIAVCDPTFLARRPQKDGIEMLEKAGVRLS
jgi:hypothetical protein